MWLYGYVYVSAYGTHKITETPVIFESFTIVPEVPNRFPHWLVATRAVEIVHLTQKGNKKKLVVTARIIVAAASTG